jgi:ADP-ribose pyrophosphatase YjhB (NUDIX family)
MQQQPPHLVTCAACGLHLYQNACSAAGLILVDAADQALLIRRAHDPGRGKLGLPGGFIDNDETLEDGLRREVREEVGLEVDAMEFLVSHPNQYAYGGVLYPTIDLFFVAHVRDFAAARPLDAVAELVVRPVAAVDAAEFAFVSMQVAWRAFLARRGPIPG